MRSAHAFDRSARVRVSVLTLLLGIGATAAIFSVVRCDVPSVARLPSQRLYVVAFPDAIARLAVGSIVLVLLAVLALMLGARVAVLPAAGTLVALVIHAWYERHPSYIPTPTEPQRRLPQINFSSTEVAGNIDGLIFVVGSVFIVVLGLSSVIWFFFAGTVAGCFFAWALVAWHTSHLEFGRPGESDRLALTSFRRSKAHRRAPGCPDLRLAILIADVKRAGSHPRASTAARMTDAAR